MTEITKFLGSVRPPRLLEKYRPCGRVVGGKWAVGVARLEYIGETELVSMRTSTRTFIAEGFASHNSVGMRPALGLKQKLSTVKDGEILYSDYEAYAKSIDFYRERDRRMKGSDTGYGY
jgi:hypothetical protein